MHEYNSFVTLTYDDDNLPDDYSLNVREWQLFYKKLKSDVRYHVGKEAAKALKFFHCGEYGETYGRPHYHACLFGLDWPDKVHYKTENEVQTFTSERLAELWGKGHCVVGAVTFDSAAYVARYCLKKRTGEQADAWYFDPGTGVILKPEYTTMSNGIGKSWYEQFGHDVRRRDEVIANEHPSRPPRYYDTLHELVSKASLARTKARRRSRAAVHADDNTPARLKVREKVKAAKLQLLPRRVE